MEELVLGLTEGDCFEWEEWRWEIEERMQEVIGSENPEDPYYE